MKRLSFVPLVLAVSLMTTIAIAAVERKAGTFQELAASGVSGKVDLMKAPQSLDATSVHCQARNLEPGTQYVVIWSKDAACAPGSETNVVTRFTANPQGIASFQGKVQTPLIDINSIAILRASDLTGQACASVIAQ